MPGGGGDGGDGGGSPAKKKPRLSRPAGGEAQAGEAGEAGVAERMERLRVSGSAELRARRRKNFVWACLGASRERHGDPARRFLLRAPPCARAPEPCRHRNREIYRPIPEHAKEGFKIDLKARTWTDALYTCRVTLSHEHYLPSGILQDILEIILNAHEDNFAGYSVTFLLDNCLQILSLMYNTHPPCVVQNIRKCYKDFLTGPLHKPENTFSNRSEFGYDKGIVKYCFNRLEYELKPDSKDDPIVNKYDNIPEEMNLCVKGLHWQKEKLDIYESLDRANRIERLMMVLENIVGLLLSDLAIWHARHTHNQGKHMMRSHKPLLAFVLWSDNVLYTGAINNNCRQIITLFVDIVCLGFPENCIKIMTLWLNAMVQTFYICETNSDKDYPNIGKYCTHFAGEFFKIVKDRPPELVIDVLNRTQPTLMRYLVGLQYLKVTLGLKEDDILKITVDFLREQKWKQFPNIQIEERNVKSVNVNVAKKASRIFTNFSKLLRTSKERMESDEINMYSKLKDFGSVEYPVSRSHVINILFITVESYIDAYGIERVRDKWDELNSQLSKDNESPNDLKYSSYTVSEDFVKRYRSIYQMLHQMVDLFSDLKKTAEYENFKIFESISMLGL